MVSKNGKVKRISTNGKMTVQEKNEFFTFLRRINANQDLSRAALFQYMTGTPYELDRDCGYPVEIQFKDYKDLIEREGIANRANSIYSSESWQAVPWCYETEAMEGQAQTPFEKAWNKLVEEYPIFSKLSKFDEVSGIGHYGALLIGVNDGRPLDQPFQGFSSLTGKNELEPTEHELLYLMPFDEGEAQLDTVVNNPASRRYGKPEFYNIMFANVQVPHLSSGRISKVHWSRIIHAADGCSSSEIIGVPRLRKVYNYILNVKKILGGSAEMFKNGGFPGTMFEVPPELVGTGELNKTALTSEIEDYLNGFKRYLALSGVQAKQLLPNIADPSNHFQVQLQALSIAMEVPMRVFLGSEEARLASMNDTEAWNKRVHRRQDLHVTPNILRPFVERLIMMGILPKPKQFHIKWPDVYSVSESDRADITGKLVRALADYVKSGASTLFPPLQFLTMIMDYTIDEAEEIILAAEEAADDDQYDFLVPSDAEVQQTKIKQAGTQKSQAGRNKPLGSTPKVKGVGQPTPAPSVNEEHEKEFLTANELSKCQRAGKPGYKCENGTCYTYTEGDAASRKRALKKAKVQSASRKMSKRLAKVPRTYATRNEAKLKIDKGE